MHPDTKRRIALALALVAIGGVILAIEKPWAGNPSAAPPPPANLSAQELAFPAAPDFGGATSWLGSAPLKVADLRGHVVLVDFWTYSCINCIHTFPHVEGFYERYKGDGLVVVGVHTPEFGFERNVDNIAGARERYHLTYPTAVDSDYAIWDAYGNRYWPAEYLIDQYGRVRDTHFGEGDYDQTEAAIRQLLAEAGHAPKAPAGEAVNATGNEGAITPELYASAAEGRVAIGNPEGYHEGQDVAYAPVSRLDPDLIYLEGTWRETHENVTALAPENASVLFRAGAANAVLDGPAGACAAVFLDGQPIPASLAGRDVDPNACLRLDGPRSYDLYAGPVEAHTLAVRLPAGGALF